MITHDNGQPDCRYTFNQEYTGHESGKPRFVVRFCGDYIGDARDLPSAVLKAVVHKAILHGEPTITEIKA